MARRAGTERSVPLATPLLLSTCVSLAATARLFAQDALPTAAPVVDAVRERARAIAAIVPTEQPPTPRTVDVVHYALHVTLDPVARQIEGRADIELRPSAAPRRMLTLDADGLRIAAVTLGDAPLPFVLQGTHLEIDLGREAPPDETLRLQITYSAAPQRGLFFAPAADGSCEMVWSQNQCQMASAWFPCRDDPDDRASSELFLTLPTAWRSISNGVLIESTPTGEALRTDHWRMDFPHPAYLTSLVAGPLVEFDLGRVRDLPLFGYALKERQAAAAASLQPTGRMIELLERFAGTPYPYPVYRQSCVSAFPWGGMENIAATTLDQDDLHAVDAAPEEQLDAQALVVHEIAHQWFGDLVTPASWGDLWLAEGFATYAELLWLEAEQGPEAAALGWGALHERLNEARLEEARPLVSTRCVEFDDLFTPIVYEGGAAVLRLLRTVVGPEKFATTVQTWLARGQNRSVSTAEFEAIASEVAGSDLQPYFVEWLHAPGLLQLDCEWRYDEASRRLELIAHQKQSGEGVPEVFHAPLAVAWPTASGRRTATIALDARRCRVAVDCEERPAFVRFNDGGGLPGVIRTQQRPEEWREQLARDSDPLGRVEAASALAAAWPTLPEEPTEVRAATLAALGRALVEEPQPPVRAAVATALGTVGGAVAMRALGVALFDGDGRVRIAAAEALRKFADEEEAASLLVRRMQSEPSTKVQHAVVHAIAAQSGARAAEALLRLALREGTTDSLRGAALAAAASCSGLPPPGVLALASAALAESAADKPLERRTGAIEALGHLAAQDATAADALGALLDDPSPKIRAFVLDALQGETIPARLLPALVAFHDRAALPDQRSHAREAIVALLAREPR